MELFIFQKIGALIEIDLRLFALKPVELSETHEKISQNIANLIDKRAIYKLLLEPFQMPHYLVFKTTGTSEF